MVLHITLHGLSERRRLLAEDARELREFGIELLLVLEGVVGVEGEKVDERKDKIMRTIKIMKSEAQRKKGASRRAFGKRDVRWRKKGEAQV